MVTAPLALNSLICPAWWWNPL